MTTRLPGFRFRHRSGQAANGPRGNAGGRAAARGHRPDLEPLEPRTLLALLGLSQQLTNPDITSGIGSNLTYIQAGNNANPFHYDAIPLLITMPDGTVARIAKQANKAPATTQLDVTLDNSGMLVAANPGTFSISGKTILNAQTYNGTLLTASPRAFGFSDAINAGNADFDTLMVVTGGALTVAGGPYKVGDAIGLAIHQSGVAIAQFPASFSSTNQTDASSDTGEVPPRMNRPQSHIPLPQPLRDPTNDPCTPTSPATPAGSTAPSGCSCNIATPTSSAATCTAVAQDNGSGAMSLYDGESTASMMVADVPGDGIDWTLQLYYRSGVQSDGALGQKWEMNYDRRLEVVTPSNLATFQAAFPAAKVGDVDLIDGSGRDDLYVSQGGGTYTSPAGFYSNLTQLADGSYAERFGDGTRYTYDAAGAGGIATMSGMSDPNGNTLRFTYNDQQELTFAYDTMGRPYQYSYDASQRLTSVTDFAGRVSRFTYDSGDNLTSVTTPAVTGTPNGNDFPNGRTTRFTYDSGHRLLTVTAPDEVMSGGPSRMVYTYDAQGRVSSLQDGGTNAANVPAGGTMSYTYQTIGTPSGTVDTTTPVRQTTATDRNGNVTLYQYNQYNNTVSMGQELDRGVDPGLPTSTTYTTRCSYDRDYRLTTQVNPDGNTVTYTYDSSPSTPRYQQGDLTSMTVTPDAVRGGDQSAITTTYTYDPIYNHVLTVTEPRGNDPNYAPQDGGAQSSSRYTTTYTYDYQEGTNFAALGAILGISPAAAAARLAAAGVPMGLGDVNGDGRTDQVAGNPIRTSEPSVTLLPGSNEAAVEGTTTQPIVTTYTYNGFGQMTSTTDPEGNVTTYTYYSQRDPNGDGVVDDPSGNPTTGGYLSQTVEDSASGAGRDSGTDPAPAAIRTMYTYDAIGNRTSMTDGRGVVTQYAYNQLDELVQVVHASGHFLTADEPLPLTDFQYIERYYYDANGNVVLHQVEDRGDTSDVGFVPAGSLPSYITNTDTAGGPMFIDTVMRYDILDQKVDTIEEVGGGTFLDTRFRYDPDGNNTLTIQPEGNASAAVYDDRNLLFRTFRGAPTPEDALTAGTSTDANASTTLNDTAQAWTPGQFVGRTLIITAGTGAGQVRPVVANSSTQLTVNAPWATLPDATSQYQVILTELGPNDPINYDVRGGAPCQCISYRYDGNGNVVETVDSDDTDLSATNNDPTLGPGDRTRYLYDGFDRRTSTIDAVGNQTVVQYDPDGNAIRVSQFGPVGGASPTSDGAPHGPVSLPSPTPSATGVIQSANLANANLLASTETSYDELDRPFQVSRVLFVNTITTARTPDVAEGGTGAGSGLGSLTPGQTQPIPGVAGVTILGRVTDRTEYDRDSRPTFDVQDDASTTRTTYDGVGRPIRTVDPEGDVTETAYDAQSNPIEVRETDVSQVPSVANEVFLTTYDYDSLDRRQQVVDNLGESTSYRYDSRGNVVAMADANGPADGSIARRAFAGGAGTVNTINAFGNVTLYSYDGLNRQVRQEQVLTANGLGDGTHIGASIFGVKDDPSAPDSFAPTPDTTQGGGDGLIRTGWNWDGDSLLSSTIDDDGNVTLYLYDDLDRQVAETGGLTANSTLTEANILGPRVIPTPTAATINNPSTIPTAEINAQLAEAKARLTVVASLFPSLADRVDDHPPTTKVWGYDPEDNVLIYQDEDNSETFTKYDAIDRAIAVRIFRAGQSDSFAGDPTFAPSPSSIPVDHSLDDGPFTPVVGTNRQDFQYDGLSRLTRATDNNDPTTAADDSVATEAYDSLGRIIEEAQTIGGQPTKVISSAWRADDLRTRLTDPSGRSIDDTYDHLDRVKSESDETTPQSFAASTPTIVTYDYIGNDRVLDRAYPQNGTRETYLDDAGTTDVGYDGLRRPVQERTLRADNSLVVGFTYTYDRMGNKLTEGKLHDAKDSETYAYDSAYRLTGFQRAPGGIAPSQTQWSYDGVGNPDQVDGESRQYSSFNELISRTSGASTTAVRSDDNGNEIDDGSFLYAWDAMNRLRSVRRKSDNALIAVYSYDALGRRIRKVVTNSGTLVGTTDFYYDGQQDVEEHDGSDALTQQFVYGIYADEPLVIDGNLGGGASAIGAGDRRFFYNQNALYSVMALTDPSGKIVEGYQYDAYGHQTVFAPGPNGVVDFGGDDVISNGGTSSVGNPYLFGGMRLDGETGLIYDRARYLDTVVDRFLSRDPLDYASDSMDLYAYAANEPTVFLDPSGLWEWYDVVFPVPTLVYELYRYNAAVNEAERLENTPRTHKASADQYFEGYKAQHPGLTPDQYTALRKTFDRGCVGITCINLGVKGMPDTSNCYDTFTKAQQREQEMAKDKTCTKKDCYGETGVPRVFSIRFWGEGKAYAPNASGKVDMTPWTYKAKPGFVNFDFGIYMPASGNWVHANHSAPGMQVYISNLQGYSKPLLDFDKQVFCVACTQWQYGAAGPKPKS